MSATMTNGRFENKSAPIQPAVQSLGRTLLEAARNNAAPDEPLIAALEKLPDGLPTPLSDAMVLVIDQVRRHSEIEAGFADRLRGVLAGFNSERLDPEETLKQMDAFVAETEQPERDDYLRFAVGVHRLLGSARKIDDPARLVIAAAEQQDPRALAAIDAVADGGADNAENVDALLRDGEQIRPHWLGGAEASPFVREVFERLQAASTTTPRRWWQQRWVIIAAIVLAVGLSLFAIISLGFAIGRATAPAPTTPEPIVLKESPAVKTPLAFNDDLGNPAYIVPIITVALPDGASVELESKITELLAKRKSNAKSGPAATRILHYRDLPIARSIPAETFAAARSRPLLAMVAASAAPADSWPLADTSRTQVCVVVIRLAAAADNSTTLQLNAEVIGFAYPDDSVLRVVKPVAISTTATSGVVEISHAVSARPGAGDAYDRLVQISVFSDDVNGVIAVEAALGLNPDRVEAMQVAAATHLLSSLARTPHFSMSGIEATPRARGRQLLRRAYVTGRAGYDAIRLLAALEGESARQQYLVREVWLDRDPEYVAYLKMTDEKQKAEVRAWAGRLRKAAEK